MINEEKEMIKVCHMTSVHARQDRRIFQKECVSLARAGFEVYLVVNDVYGNELKDGVHIISSAYQSKNRIDRIFHADRKVYKKALQVEADIYHFHDPELLPYGWLLKKRGKKVIFDSHEFTWKQIECRDYLPKILRKLISMLYRTFEKAAVRRMDAVIVPCTYDGKRYFGSKCRREVLINNLPDIDGLDDADVKFSDRKPQACYIGSLSKERGIMKMAQACKKADVPLVLAGTFVSNELKKEVLGVSRRITYKGNLAKPEVERLLNESYIGLSVLQDEGQYKHLDNLPTKVYEYMASGMPVLVSGFPYYRKVMQKYNCGICVRADSVEEIAAGMQWMLKHLKEAEKMGRNGKRIVMRKYNWEAEEKKLLKLYYDIVEELD